MLKTGMVVNSTVTSAPSSTKNDSLDASPVQGHQQEQTSQCAQGAVGEGQSQHPCQGRTPALYDQVPVRPSISALSRTGQKHQPAAGDVCHIEPVDA